MMTEKQSKEKFCPFSRAHCLGSKCMAWKWQFNNKDHESDQGYCRLVGELANV